MTQTFPPGLFALFGLIRVVLYIVAIVVAVMLVIAIFQIRKSTKHAAQRLDDIYRLLSEQRKQ